MARRRVLIIVNPHASGPAPRLAEAVARRARALGGEIELVMARTEGEAADAARAADGFDALAVAGGDGAVRRVAGMLGAHAPPLAVLPAGAANMLARALGGPFDAAGLAAVVMRGVEGRIALGWANGSPFLVAAGAGLDGRAAAAVDPGLKQRAPFGAAAAAYGVGLARAWLHDASGSTAHLQRKHSIQSGLDFIDDALEIDIDGVRRGAAWALALNAGLWPGAIFNAARMRIALFPPRSALGRAGDLAALAAGRLALAPGVRITPFHRARITSAAPLPIQVDGEALGLTPLFIEIDPRPVRVLLRPQPSPWGA